MRDLRRLAVLGFFVFLALAAETRGAVVWLPGVDETSGWNDVNKEYFSTYPAPPPAGANDSLFCWAASASNLLSWGHWWGWNPVTSDYLATAADIYSTFDAGWSDKESSPVYAYEWWMTDRTQTILDDNGPLEPGGTTLMVFDSPGKNFYPTANAFEGLDATLYEFNYRDLEYRDPDTGDIYFPNADNYIRDYIAAGQGVTIAINVLTPNPDDEEDETYGHVLTVWGWDDDTDTLYFTDSDDATGLRFAQIVKVGDYWYLQDYSNVYTPVGDAMLTEVHRLNRNDLGAGGTPLEPNKEVNGGVPEPATLGLLGAGLLALLIRKSKKAN